MPDLVELSVDVPGVPGDVTYDGARYRHHHRAEQHHRGERPSYTNEREVYQHRKRYRDQEDSHRRHSQLARYEDEKNSVPTNIGRSENRKVQHHSNMTLNTGSSENGRGQQHIMPVYPDCMPPMPVPPMPMPPMPPWMMMGPQWPMHPSYLNYPRPWFYPPEPFNHHRQSNPTPRCLTNTPSNDTHRPLTTVQQHEEVKPEVELKREENADNGSNITEMCTEVPDSESTPAITVKQRVENSIQLQPTNLQSQSYSQPIYSPVTPLPDRFIGSGLEVRPYRPRFPSTAYSQFNNSAPPGIMWNTQVNGPTVQQNQRNEHSTPGSGPRLPPPVIIHKVGSWDSNFHTPPLVPMRPQRWWLQRNKQPTVIVPKTNIVVRGAPRPTRPGPQ